MFKKNVLSAALLLSTWSATAVAEDGGNNDIAFTVINFYCDVANVMGGPIGVTVGLFIALYGFYKFVMTGSMGGLGIILVGALVPAFPSVFASFTQGVAAGFSHTEAGGANTASHFNDRCVYGDEHITAPKNTKPSEGQLDKEELKKDAKEEEKKAMKDALDNYGPLRFSN